MAFKTTKPRMLLLDSSFLKDVGHCSGFSGTRINLKRNRKLGLTQEYQTFHNVELKEDCANDSPSVYNPREITHD